MGSKRSQNCWHLLSDGGLRHVEQDQLAAKRAGLLACTTQIHNRQCLSREPRCRLEARTQRARAQQHISASHTSQWRFPRQLAHTAADPRAGPAVLEPPLLLLLGARLQHSAVGDCDVTHERGFRKHARCTTGSCRNESESDQLQEAHPAWKCEVEAYRQPRARCRRRSSEARGSGCPLCRPCTSIAPLPTNHKLQVTTEPIASIGV